MAHILIVDENDIEIGSKERSEIQSDNIYRVTALWLTNSNGSVLMTRRALAKKNSPGKWSCAVAGTVEKDESYDDNIIKETREELGISLTMDHLRTGPKLRINGRGRTFFVQWYFYVSDAPLNTYTIDHSEASEIRWIDAHELLKWIVANPSDFTTGLAVSFPKLINVSSL